INGMSSTETTNGLGNLIVGYNETRLPSAGDVRLGSHNIIVGSKNDYSSYGGIVAGNNNGSRSFYASVLGGIQNTASGPYSSVSGGTGNNASGQWTSISGGAANTASGNYA